MQEADAANGILSLFPLILMSLFMSITAHLLAREKGRNVLKWTILGAIPVVNALCFGFFIGAANLRLERKMDELAERLDALGARR